MIRRLAGAAALLAIALALAGCGLLGGARASRAAAPTSSSPASTTAAAQSGSSSVATSSTSTSTATPGVGAPSATAIARARRTHELPTPAAPVRVTGGWRTPTGAVQAFASVYINWTAATVDARLRALARASVGQARAEMSTEAQEIGRDRELHAGGIANAGLIESVAPLAGDPRSDTAHSYTVVTRERTSAARDNAYRGLVAQWHVSVASVTRLSDGLWVVSRWQPES